MYLHATYMCACGGDHIHHVHTHMHAHTHTHTLTHTNTCTRADKQTDITQLYIIFVL